MKKFYAFVIAGVLMLSVTGCFDKTDGPDMAGVAAEEEKAKIEAGKSKKSEAEEKEAAEEEEKEEEKTAEAEPATEPEEEPVQVVLPEELSALGYDSAYIIDHTNMICMPYSSEKYHFNDSAVEEIRGDGHSIYAFVYDFPSNFEFGRDSTREKAAENDAELQDLTIGDFTVLASTTKPYFYATEYYVDFNGKFGDLKGAFVKASESKGEKELTLSGDVQDMIANIFKAE